MSSSDTKTLQWPNHREGSKISDPIRFEEGPDDTNCPDCGLDLAEMASEEMDAHILKHHPEYAKDWYKDEEDKFFPGQEAQWTEDEHRVLKHGGKYERCPICFPEQEGMLLEQGENEGIDIAYSGGSGENILGGDPIPFDADIPASKEPTDLQNVTPFSQQQYTPSSTMTGYGQENPNPLMEQEELEPQIDADVLDNDCGFDCCSSIFCECKDCATCSWREGTKKETNFSADDEYDEGYEVSQDTDSAACSLDCCPDNDCNCGDCDACSEYKLEPSLQEVKDPRERDKAPPKELSPEAQKIAGTDEESMKNKGKDGMPKIEVKISDKITILGKTGSGKTNLIKVLLTDIFPDYEFVLLDSLGNFAEYEGKPNIEYHMVTPTNTEEVDQIIYAAMEKGNCMVVMDEVDRFSSQPGTMLNELVNVGRNYNVGGIFAGRRTADISKDILANSAYIFTFQHILPQDLLVLTDWFAQPEETFRDLQEYEAILFNNGIQVWQGVVPEKPTTTPTKAPTPPKPKKGKSKDKEKGKEKEPASGGKGGESIEKEKIKEKKGKSQAPPTSEPEPESEPEAPEEEPPEEAPLEEPEKSEEEETRVGPVWIPDVPSYPSSSSHRTSDVRPHEPYCDQCYSKDVVPIPPEEDPYRAPSIDYSDVTSFKCNKCGEITKFKNANLSYEKTEEAKEPHGWGDYPYGGYEGVFPCMDCDTVLSIFDTPSFAASPNTEIDEETYNKALKELDQLISEHLKSHGVSGNISDEGEEDADLDDDGEDLDASDLEPEEDLDTQIEELQKTLEGLGEGKGEEISDEMKKRFALYGKPAKRVCSECGAKYVDPTGDSKENICEKCMGKRQTDFQEEGAIKSEGAFQCNRCPQSFKYERDFLSHLAEAH
jgi:energy-coupling factor transporter ATP-binding protein EcfA2